jgi:glycosyltransferase involved in cell wall biosynthesis
MLLPKLEERGAVRVLEGYRPYFNLDNRSQRLEFKAAPPGDYFGVGRVSRDDPQKFAAETWMTFAKVSAPRHIKVFMLGFGDQAQKKCGNVPPCNWLDWMYWTPGAIPVHEFFQKIHVLIHRTGGSRENWPRIVLEAWASGVPVIVDNDYGVAEMVRDGETGFCVGSFDEGLRQRIAAAAHDCLRTEHASPERSQQPFEHLLAD